MLQPISKPAIKTTSPLEQATPREPKRRFTVSAEIITSGGERSRQLENQIQEIVAKMMKNADKVLHVRFSSRQAEKEALNDADSDKEEAADR
jgi:hypothetical protein